MQICQEEFARFFHKKFILAIWHNCCAQIHVSICKHHKNSCTLGFFPEFNCRKEETRSFSAVNYSNYLIAARNFCREFADNMKAIFQKRSWAVCPEEPKRISRAAPPGLSREVLRSWRWSPCAVTAAFAEWAPQKRFEWYWSFILCICNSPLCCASTGERT